jgi:hypothetical protein
LEEKGNRWADALWQMSFAVQGMSSKVLDGNVKAEQEMNQRFAFFKIFLGN